MKHYLLLSIFICLWGSPSFGQQAEPPVFEWAESFGGPGTEGVSDWIISSDGSIYLTGSYLYWLRFGDTIKAASPWTNFQHDAYVMKLGPDLQVDWVQSIGGMYNDNSVGIEFDSKGDLWWAGNYRGNIGVGEDTLYGLAVDTATNRTQGKIFCIRLDSESGQIDDAFSFGGFDFAKVSDLSIGIDGGLNFSGILYQSPGFIFQNDTIPLASSELSHIFVATYYPQSKDKQLSFLSATESVGLDALSVEVNHNGDIHLEGKMHGELSYKDSTLYNGDFRQYHTILDSIGNIKLFQTFPKHVTIDKIVFDSWGNYYLIGEAVRLLDEESNTYSYQKRMKPGIFIQKSSPGGFDTKWFNFPGKSTSHVSAQTQDENLVLAGTYTDSLLFNEIILRPPENSVNKRDAFIAKIDREGKTIWARTAGGEYGEAILDIKEREKNQYVVMGYMETGFTFMDTFFLSQPFVLPYEYDHFLGILSKDSSGPPLPYISDDSESRFALFPNPSSGNLTIWGAFENSQWQLQLFDLAGRLVWKQTIQTRTGQARLPISFQSVAPGMYHLVCNSQQKRFTTSIMIE